MPTEPVAPRASDRVTSRRLLQTCRALGGRDHAPAWQTRNRPEVRGQLLRPMLVPPGQLPGRLPLGNTGRSQVEAFRPVPVAPKLMATIRVHQGAAADR